MNETRKIISAKLIGQVGVITLDDAEHLNPMSLSASRQLRQELRLMRQNSAVRALLLTGTGRAFCAGGDMNGFGGHSPVAIKLGMVESQEVVREIVELPMPVVMAVNGAAAGAGFSLAVAGDIVIAANDARFVPAFNRIGAVPDLGLARLLQRSIGLHRTLSLLLTGEALSADQAKEMGLVSRVVPAADLFGEALAMASALAAGPTVSLALTKKLVREAASESWAAFLEAEASAQVLAFSTADFTEGVQAFLAKRKPAFHGS
jgi:2-(1,2-epoxy-1,2-dihydrophenyl)acetyl-CoA isomerase